MLDWSVYVCDTVESVSYVVTARWTQPSQQSETAGIGRL